MENCINNSDFENCKNMIYKLVRTTYKKNKSRRPDVQFEDVLSEGFLVYSWCLQNFKGNKGMKFTTYLFMNLRVRLINYYQFTMSELHHYEDYNLYNKDGTKEERFEDNISSTNYNYNSEWNKELMELAKDKLSYEAYQVLEYIVSWNWVSKWEKAKPTLKTLCNKFGYKTPIMKSIMNEIEIFWQKQGHNVA